MGAGYVPEPSRSQPQGRFAVRESAHDTGITHFDVAPLYGYGEAEGCLGEFLKGHANATVTTKYGIPPPRNQGVLRAARRIAGPVLKLLPGMKSRLARAAGAIARSSDRPPFTAEQARLSLESSMRELQRDHIDIWLLHEVTVEELRDEALLRFLEDSITAGKIGTFGAASERGKLDELMRDRAPYCRTVQYEWSVLDADPPQASGLRIQHRALTENYRLLHTALRGDSGVCRRWSEQTGRDLAYAEQLAALMLRASLDINSAGLVLFSSKSKPHMEVNVRIAQDDSLQEPARRLREIARSEGPALLASACKV